MTETKETQLHREQSVRGVYLTAFLAPVLIVIIILICNRAFPFGEECFLRTDMYHQYAPFFSELQEKLHGGGSLLYSWNIGLGVNFAALYAYYLASPLNWLIVFCPKAYIIEFMTLMVIFKIGLSGLAMTWYLKDRFRRNDFGAGLFGIFYALSGYMAAYYWNLMWLDCIILFPLIVRGLERLVEEKKGVLYAAALGMSILSNYYISIMTCMFLVIYFGMLNILCAPRSGREFFARCLRFAGYSLLSGGIAAVLLLPEIAALTQTASYDINFPQTVTQYFTIIDMFARQLVGVETEQGLDHWPNIYCGVAALLFFVMYLYAKRISLKEKAVYVGMLLFFFLSFSLNVLNFIWHGFHYPNSLPARQSFIYIFLMLFVCYRVYQQKAYLGKWDIGRAFLISAAFILLCQKLITAKHFHFGVYYGSLALIAVYALLLYLYRTRKIKRTLASLLALCVVMAEAAANTAVTSITTTSRTAYTADNEDVRTLVDGLLPSTEFFRVEKISRKTKNDGAWMNFPSVSLFSSMANADCTAFFKALGCEASTNAYSITGSTPFVNMLFSVKYAIYNEPQEDGEEKKFIESVGESYLYQNNYTLPLGFMMPEGMSERWVQDMDNPALVQDALCDMLGTSALLIPNEEYPSESGQDFAITIAEDGEYYAFVTNPQVKKVTVSVGDFTKTYENVDRGYFIELGQRKRGELVSMTSETDGQAMQAQVYHFDYGALKEVYNKLSAYPFELSVWEDSRLRGTVLVSPERLGYAGSTATMFLSIPYDEGWQVTVDGMPVKAKKVFDTFMGIPLTAGVHTIELNYMPKGLLTGAVISGSSFLILLILWLLGRRRNRISEREYEEYDGYDAYGEGGACTDENGAYEACAYEAAGAEVAASAAADEAAPADALPEETAEAPEASGERTEGTSETAEPQEGEKAKGASEDPELSSVVHFKKTKNELLERLKEMKDLPVPGAEEAAGAPGMRLVSEQAAQSGCTEAGQPLHGEKAQAAKAVQTGEAFVSRDLEKPRPASAEDEFVEAIRQFSGLCASEKQAKKADDISELVEKLKRNE